MRVDGDYISREAVTQIIAAQCGECADACLEFDGIQPDCNQCLLGGAAKAIKTIPAADVRPVVLCRDCTFFKPQQKSTRWSSATPMCSRSATIKMPPDGFCSFGIKREKN